MKNFVVSTFVTGVILLVPVFFLTFTLTRSFAAFRDIVAPMVERLDIDRVAGFLLLNAVVVLVLAVFIFLLGLLARLPAIETRIRNLDRLLTDRVPGYTIFKGVVTGALDRDTSVSSFKTVLVRDNETGRIGFEVERTRNGGVVVFLPNTPNPQTGTAAAFAPENVEPLDIPPHKALEILNFYGKGISEPLAEARIRRGVVSDS